MNFLKKFKQLISTKKGQIVSRQCFYVLFSGLPILKDAIIPINDIGLYIQEFDLPNLSLDEENHTIIKNPRGTYSVPGDGLIIPEANTFSIDFLETEVPVIETVFVPWLEKVVNIRNSGEYPFPKATVTVYILPVDNNNKGDFLNENDAVLTYRFFGVYPTLITLPTLTNSKNENITRGITFNFNKISLLTNNTKSLNVEEKSKEEIEVLKIIDDYFNFNKNLNNKNKIENTKKSSEHITPPKEKRLSFFELTEKSTLNAKNSNAKKNK
jgi:hypothetical protein